MNNPSPIRSHFLRHHWHPFPSWSTPNKSSQYFGGRIVEIDSSPKKKRLVLRGGQPAILRHFEMKSCHWHPSLVTGDAPPPLSVLQVNDVIQIEVDSSQAPTFNRQWSRAHSVALLAPNEGELLLSSCPQNTYQRWQSLIQGVNQFFTAHQFEAIQTPTLVTSPGSEPFLDPFVLELQVRGERKTQYLPTSPELHLKKALCQGWERIYEIRPCFRNGEWGPHHRPEFYMLEWYRAFGNLDEILLDCRHLFSWVARVLGLPAPAPFVVMTTREAFKRFVHPDFTLTPKTHRHELATLALQLKIEITETDTFDDIFFRIFLDKIESQLRGPTPFVLRDYPPTQAALARFTSEGWADRFEIYWQGLEIANAFHELNDPREQRLRLKNDNDRKRAIGKAPIPCDDQFLRGLDSGMPPSGGIALGLERLFLAFHPHLSISDLRPFELIQDLST